MKEKCVRIVWVLLLWSSVAPVWAADGVTQLQQFVKATRSAEGAFIQTVTAKSGRKPQQASGKFAFLRPGKFRWAYERPYAQLLVSDGTRLWSWDPDLNQVTVKRIGDALGATPAAILFGDLDLERNFTLTNSGEDADADDLVWVDARPKKADTSFQSVRIGLRGGQLIRMEMQDNFGQHTEIVFIRFQVNPVLETRHFVFDVPPGADVVGDLEN